MKQNWSPALWSTAILSAGLYVVQTVLANADALTARYAITLLAVAGAAWVLTRRPQTAAPEPISLALAGVVALCLWAPAWWLMDWTNSRLERAFGMLDRAASITVLDDPLIVVDLHAASYELEILFAVVLLPLALAWLIGGALLPELARGFGRWRAMWLAGAVGGVLMTLSAVQNVAPALPWGLASLGGYLLIGIAASLVMTLTGSAWAGFSLWGTFAYASFAWRDDLFREFTGKGYLDPAWLTVIVLGVFGAVVVLNVIRFRVPRPAEPPRHAFDPVIGIWLPLVLALASVVVMAALDILAR